MRAAPPRPEAEVAKFRPRTAAGVWFAVAFALLPGLAVGLMFAADVHVVGGLVVGAFFGACFALPVWLAFVRAPARRLVGLVRAGTLVAGEVRAVHSTARGGSRRYVVAVRLPSGGGEGLGSFDALGQARVSDRRVLPVLVAPGGGPRLAAGAMIDGALVLGEVATDAKHFDRAESKQRWLRRVFIAVFVLPMFVKSCHGLATIGRPPSCDSPNVKKVLNGLLPQGAPGQLAEEPVRLLSERQVRYDASTKTRMCRASVRQSRGEASIAYSISWTDRAAGTFRVDVTPPTSP